MSIADKISRLSTAKTNIANAITAKGGTVTSGDGFEDFATDIGTISTGITPTGSLSITENGTYDVTEKASAVVNVPQAIPIEISTDAGMTAVLVAANVGKAYKFTGTTGTYTNGDIYVVEESA